MNISVNDLMLVIGEKEIQIRILQSQLETALKKLAEIDGKESKKVE